MTGKSSYQRYQALIIEVFLLGEGEMCAYHWGY